MKNQFREAVKENKAKMAEIQRQKIDDAIAEIKKINPAISEASIEAIKAKIHTTTDWHLNIADAQYAHFKRSAILYGGVIPALFIAAGIVLAVLSHGILGAPLGYLIVGVVASPYFTSRSISTFKGQLESNLILLRGDLADVCRATIDTYLLAANDTTRTIHDALHQPENAVASRPAPEAVAEQQSSHTHRRKHVLHKRKTPKVTEEAVIKEESESRVRLAS